MLLCAGSIPNLHSLVLSVVQELRDCYKFKQYILITRVYSDPLAAAAAGGGAGPSSSSGSMPPPKPKKKAKQQQVRGMADVLSLQSLICFCTVTFGKPPYFLPSVWQMRQGKTLFGGNCFIFNIFRPRKSCSDCTAMKVCLDM